MKGLLRKRNALLKEFDQCSDFVRGSISGVCATCNRAHCICQKKSSRRAFRLTYKNGQQKTQIVYVHRRQLPIMRKMIANYARARKIIEQLVETNIAVFKEKARR